MAQSALSGTKAAVIAVFLITIFSVMVLAVIMERPVALQKEFDSNQPVQYKTTKAFSTNEKDLQAIVKGSIYETGSNMTVFGACEDGNGYLVSNSTANFTAWYPNGTMLMGPNETMDTVVDPAGSGRFKIHVTMPNTIGTYFTEMRCSYKGDYALAYGEWQNPEWVKKIGDTYVLLGEVNDTMHNISLTQEQMMVLFNTSFSQNISAILNALAGLNTTITNRTYEWVVDLNNNKYNNSFTGPRWNAVDMRSSRVFIAAKDGEYGFWNTLIWQYGKTENVSWYGVSGFDPTLNYFWLAGRNGPYSDVALYLNSSQSEAVYSVGGATPQTIPNATAGAFVDLQIFRAPNATFDQFSVLVMGNDGSMYYSDTQGANWTEFWTNHSEPYALGGKGRLSGVQWITNQSDFTFAVVTQGGTFMYHNGTIVRQDNASRTYEDVVLIKPNLAYAVGVEGGFSKIWRFNGTLAEVAMLPDTIDNPVAGIAGSSENDIWVSMDDPSIFYHWDGSSWNRVVFPYTGITNVNVGFNNGGPVISGGDISVYGVDKGYVVSGGGLIMKLVVNDQFQQVLNAIQLVVIGAGGGGMSTDQYNALMGNITYTQGYLETVIYPTLVDLGLMKAQVNATLEIVNRTESKVDVLLNRTQDRPRVWTTQ